MPAIFGFGTTGGTGGGAVTNITNLVDNTGAVAADVSGVGTARRGLAAAGYGGDKAIFGFGWIRVGFPIYSMTNLVDNTGVVATDTTGVGSARYGLAAAGYGGDKAIFGFGQTGDNYTFCVSTTNLVDNTGVVATDTTTVAAARTYVGAASYGGDKAIFGFGYAGQSTPSWTVQTNLVDNTGVVAADVITAGATPRYGVAAAGYGGDKAIFGFGRAIPDAYVSVTNLVDNTGVVATDTTGVGTARGYPAAAGFGGDQAIFGFGSAPSSVSITNLVSNTGVVATDTSTIGTGRYELAAASYGTGSSPTTTTTTTAAPGTTTTTTAAPGTTTTTTAAPTITQYTLTNIGTEGLTIQSMVFNDPPNIGHTANLVNLGGSSTETGNASLTYNLAVSATQTFTVDYTNAGASPGTYYGNVIISGSDNTSQTINSTITVGGGGGTTSTTTAAPGTTTTTTSGPTPPLGLGAIFGFGSTGTNVSITNLVSDTGVVAADTTSLGTARTALAAAGYGSGQAIFGFGQDVSGYTNITNLVNNLGVVAADQTALTGTARAGLAAAGYGGDKAIFGFGYYQPGGIYDVTSVTNLVDNTGVVATDTTGVGTARFGLAAAGYGGDKAIFGFGGDFLSDLSTTNLVSNTGVVAADQTALTGTARNLLAAASYGGDKAIFGFGIAGTNVPSAPSLSMTNLVTNTGVVATDTTGVGTARSDLAAAGYGGDKAIFGFGLIRPGLTYLSTTNLVSNTGVVVADQTALTGTARANLAGASVGSAVTPTSTTTTSGPTTTTTTTEAPTTTTTTIGGGPVSPTGFGGNYIFVKSTPGVASLTLRLDDDGGWRIVQASTGSFPAVSGSLTRWSPQITGNWYSPTTPSIGSSYLYRLTVNGIQINGAGTVTPDVTGPGSWLPFSGAAAGSVAITSGSGDEAIGDFTIEIAVNNSGSPGTIVSTTNFNYNGSRGA